MSELATAQDVSEEPIDEEKKSEENQEDTDIISLRARRLLKLKHNIHALRKEALQGFSKELQECKKTCQDINDLLGELNDASRGEQTS